MNKLSWGIVGLLAASLGFASTVNAQYAYPSFDVNATPARQTITLSGEVIPPTTYVGYTVTIDWSAAAFLGSTSAGAQFKFVDRLPAFYGFPAGTLTYANSGVSPTSQPNGTSRTISWSGTFTTPYIGGRPLYFSFTQSPGISASWGNVRINLIAAPPANDSPAGAVAVPASGPWPFASAPTVMLGSATTSADDPQFCSPTSRTVWYSFTPDSSGEWVMSTCAESAPANNVNDTVIGVFNATAQMSRVACSSTSCATRSTVTTTLTAGSQYFIVLGKAGNGQIPFGESTYQFAMWRNQSGPLPCNIADVVDVGGFTPPDGRLTPDDFIAYINAFANGDILADIVDIGGMPPPDGRITPDDLIAFINAYFAGCP